MHRRVLTADVVITIGFLAIGTTAVVQAWRWPVRAALFPLLVGSLLAVLALLALIVEGARRDVPASKRGSVDTPDIELQDVFGDAPRAVWVSSLGWAGSFFLLLWLLGPLVSIPLFALVYLLVVSRESLLLAGAYALASWLFVYGLFDRLLHLPLPRGTLW